MSNIVTTYCSYDIHFQPNNKDYYNYLLLIKHFDCLHCEYQLI